MSPVSRRQVLSPSATLFTAYPGAFRYVDDCITRVREITHPEGDRSDPLSNLIRQAIARRIDAELSRVRAHADERARRMAARRGEAPAPGAAPQDPFLADLFGGGEVAEPAPLPEPPVAVSMADVGLIRVDADASVRTRIYPRSFHCQACDHYLLVDPERPPTTLDCLCCRTGRLAPEPIVMFCARCAAVHELLPPGGRAGRYRRQRQVNAYTGVPPDCPDCSRGHIHLLKHQTSSIGRWEWACRACGSFREPLQERCLECVVPAGPNAQLQPVSMIFMQPAPASASNAFVPLTDVEMFVRNAPLDPTSLRAAATSGAPTWREAFDLDAAVAAGRLSRQDQAAFRDSCIQAAYLVNQVRVATTVFGYRAGPAASHSISPVNDGDRLARFFEDRERIYRYLCYSMISEGAALVLELDRERIIERLAVLDPSLRRRTYDAVLGAELLLLQNRPVRDLLRTEGCDLLLYRSIHAVEHALLAMAIQQIGSEVLSSRLFLSAGIIVLYEREPVGRGGVIQLVNKGKGLRLLLDGARDHVLGCMQGCADGCPTCTYVQDAHCVQPLDEIGRGVWLPPNALLSRTGSRAVLASDVEH